MQKRAIFFLCFVLTFFGATIGSLVYLPFPSVAMAVDRDASMVEVVSHEWYIDETWDKIGKTKYVWKVTLQNHSDVRKRVYAYYYLLDANDVPLARNVANRFVGPHQTEELVANSYIMTYKVPHVTRSRISLKVGFPN